MHGEKWEIHTPPRRHTLKKVALHRRGSSQCGAKKKPKNCETVTSWSVLSHFIGLLS